MSGNEGGEGEEGRNQLKTNVIYLLTLDTSCLRHNYHII